MIDHTAGYLPTTFELHATVELTPNPWQPPPGLVWNTEGHAAPALFVSHGDGPMEQTDVPGLELWLGVLVNNEAIEDLAAEVSISGAWSFVANAHYCATLEQLQDEQVIFTTVYLGVPTQYVDLGPVNNLRHAQSNRATIRVQRIDDAYSVVLRSIQDPHDFNRDGETNASDLFDYLAVFSISDPAADYNDDGTITSQDFYGWLTRFLTGD
jgi:hypothetical protein